MRAGVTLLGMTERPLCTWNLMQTCAGDLSYFLQISNILGSSISDGSPGFAQGRSGEPRGLYAVTEKIEYKENVSF